MGTTRIVRSRRCDRCGDKTPIDEVVRTEVEHAERDYVMQMYLCLLCASQFRLAFLWGADPDYTYWYRTP